MKQEYKKAFSEVNEIIKMMPKELKEKIPNDFRKMIERERDVDYFPNISEPLENCKFKNETIIILGLIYRDFLCDEEERRRLQKKDNNDLQELKKSIEKIKRESSVDVFKKKNETEKVTKEDRESLTVVKKGGFLKNIIYKLKKILKK